MIIVVDPVQAEAELGAGRLGCPHCGGQLARWAHGRPRRVRMRDGSHRSLRPRRARCHACGPTPTQMLLPGWCSPGRGEATEVIGGPAGQGRRDGLAAHRRLVGPARAHGA